MGKNENIRIGIIYIAIGIYDEFWKDFYPSCQCYFCPDTHKGFEVFTDSLRLQKMNLKNVFWHPVKDKGFIYNVSAKSEFICAIADKLKEKYDYIFFLNGNFKFVEPILSIEVIPSEENDYITALSFDFNKDKTPDELPYDRNPQCLAYMEYGEGRYYYQGGFYGGRTLEILQMSDWIRQRIETDLSKKIIARWHDESYVNKYLSNYNPRILNETYAFVEEHMEFRPHKNIVLDKKKYLGEKLDNYKDLSIDNTISFLLDEKLNIHKIGVVKTQGRLGNQMFQYAYLLYLRKKYGNTMDFYLYPNNEENLSDSFPFIELYRLPEEFKISIAKMNPKQAEKIEESEISCIQEVVEPQKALTVYSGYWQCHGYADEVMAELKESFVWNDESLCDTYQMYRDKMRTSCSISIHIRRGDYQSNKNKDVYGSICTLSYYRKAIRKMKELLGNEITFYIFTDEPEWVQTYFSINDCVLVEKPKNIADWQDMCLMSSCKHHIIANSSFSWWGAWLGENSEKIVIAPEVWYSGLSTPDLLPETWIRIPVGNVLDMNRRLSSHLLFKKIMTTQQMPYWDEMTHIIYYFHLGKRNRNTYYRKEANQKLDELLNHLGAIITIIEFIKVCQGLVFLYNKHFISGNPNEIFGVLDDYLGSKISSCSNDNLIEMAEYFKLRLKGYKGKNNASFKLKEMLYDVLKRLWQEKSSLSDIEKDKIFTLLQNRSFRNFASEYADELFMFCLRSMDISRLLKSEDV